MQTAGNVLLILSVLAAAYLFKLTFLQKMPGGDSGVGYAWAILFFIAVFWVCMALIAGIVGYSGGFAWLSLGRFAGGGMLALGFLVLLLGSTLGMEASLGGIRWLAPVNAVATALVLLVAFTVLLNDNLKMSVSPSLIKWGLTGVLAVNCLMLAMMVVRPIFSNVGAVLSRSSGELDDFQLGMLAQIDSCDPSKGITSLFIYGSNNQPREIREKATLKIKSKPGWQDDLYQALDSDRVDEAFGFLLATDVDDKPRFAQGVYQGVLSQARLIRESLRRSSHPSHVYDGKFGFEVERSLQVVEKFKDQGVDFKPAVQELRAALDEPIAYDNPNPSCKRVLDKWLKKH